jgi:hypothetical protein
MDAKALCGRATQFAPTVAATNKGDIKVDDGAGAEAAANQCSARSPEYPQGH